MDTTHVRQMVNSRCAHLCVYADRPIQKMNIRERIATAPYTKMMHIDRRFVFEYSLPSLEVANIINRKTNETLDSLSINRGVPYYFTGDKYVRENGDILHIFLFDSVIEEIEYKLNLMQC